MKKGGRERGREGRKRKKNKTGEGQLVKGGFDREEAGQGYHFWGGGDADGTLLYHYCCDGHKTTLLSKLRKLCTVRRNCTIC